MKLLHLLTIIFFMFFVACSSPSSSNEEQEVVTEETTKETVIEKETPTEELIQVDAKAISKEIGKNVIAVEIKYMGKEVTVTNCKVLGIEKEHDEYILKVKNSDLETWESFYHIFYFDKDQMQSFADLKKGQIIKVRGLVSELEEYNVYGILTMRHSKIIR